MSVLLAVVLTACRPTSAGSPSLPPTAPHPDATRLPSPSLTEQSYVPPPDGVTAIMVDGLSDDWARYPPVLVDAAGDQTGDADLLTVSAFVNDAVFYLMVEASRVNESPVRVSVTLNDPPAYWIDVTLEEEPRVLLVPAVPGPEVHKVEYTASYDRVLEVSVPLSQFGGVSPEDLLVTLYDGTLLDRDAPESDSGDWAKVLRVEEREPSFLSQADLAGDRSIFCTEASLSVADNLLPAEGVRVPPGFTAEYLIAPTGVNMPSDVVTLPDGGIVVASARAGKFLRISPDGEISEFAPVNGSYTVDRDAEGYFYGYNMPLGQLFRVTPTGVSSLILESDEIKTYDESPMAVSADGVLYLAPNLPEAFIYEVQGQRLRKLPEGYREVVTALDVRADGVLYAVIGNGLYTVDRESGAGQRVAGLPASSTFHGLDVLPDGTAYVVLDVWQGWNTVYRVSPDGQVELFFKQEMEPFEGISVADDGALFGVQRATGGIWRISPDGLADPLVPPSGLNTPETPTFSPCGDLLVVMEEGGSVGVFSPDGRLQDTIRGFTFDAPHLMAMSPQGWFVMNQSMPPLPEHWFLLVLPDTRERILSSSLNARGHVVTKEGLIYTTLPEEGAIITITPGGEQTVFLDGLDDPRLLALAPDGTFYLVTGQTRVTAIAPSRSVSVLAETREPIRHLAVGPDGWVYLNLSQSIQRVDQQGHLETVFSGFHDLYGIAFDAGGVLYAVENRENAVLRIRGFETYALTGRVVGQEDGNPLAGVRVRAVQAYPPFAGKVTETDSDGAFQFTLSPGVYDVTAWLDGYGVSAREGIDLHRTGATLELALPEKE